MAEFDQQEALSLCGNDRALMRELIEILEAQLPKWLATADTALATGNAVALNRAAHSVKGAVGTFGAKAAWQAALDLEVIAKEGRLAEAPAALAALRVLLGRLMPELSAFRP